MEKWFKKIEAPLMKFGDRINNVVFFNVMRDAFMLALPLIIFGSIVTIIANFPFLDSIIGTENATNWKNLLTPASDATINIMTLFVCAGIGYYFSKHKGCDAIYGAAIAVCAFMIIFPWVTGSTYGVDADGNVTDELLIKNTTMANITQLGAKGMFVGIFGSFFASWIYCWCKSKDWEINMPESVPPAVSKGFAALVPACITLTIFLIIRIVFSFTPWHNVFDFVYEFVQTPLVALGSSLPALVIMTFFIQFFWFFGLHGQIIANSVFDPIWNTLMMENLAAFNAGAAIPNVMCAPFIVCFTIGLGGSGGTLIVLILMAILCKSKQMKNLSKLALPAGVFNVNEPFIFGLPIIFNPLIIIPWILGPMISVSVAFLAMQFGIVPCATGVSVPWTTPVILSGFLATNSWKGGVLQIVQMLIIGLIWLPFIKILDKKALSQEQNNK